MDRSRGARSKSRNKLKNGRFSIAQALQDFSEGTRVRIKINPAVHKGMPHHRYQNVLGTVTGKRGASFLVDIMDQNKAKTIMSRPEHLMAAK